MGLFLAEKNLGVDRGYLAADARVFVNSAAPGDYCGVDARRLAEEMGEPVATNLILLGFAVAKGGLFCEAALLERIIREKIPARFQETNLRAWRLGVAAATK